PLRDAAGIEYLFAWSGFGRWAVCSAVMVIGLTALFAFVVHLAERSPHGNPAEARSGRWLAPLAGLGCVTARILPAVPAVGRYGVPFGSFFYDLRWFWTLALGLWTLSRADATMGEPVARRLRQIAAWSPVARTLIIETLLVTTVLIWAVATTPNLRFTAS